MDRELFVHPDLLPQCYFCKKVPTNAMHLDTKDGTQPGTPPFACRSCVMDYTDRVQWKADPVMRNEIRHASVYCVYQHCFAEVGLYSLKRHVKMHMERSIACTFRKCVKEGIPCKGHEECDYKPYICSDCDSVVLQKNKGIHESHSSKKVIYAGECMLGMTLRELIEKRKSQCRRYLTVHDSHGNLLKLKTCLPKSKRTCGHDKEAAPSAESTIREVQNYMSTTDRTVCVVCQYRLVCIKADNEWFTVDVIDVEADMHRHEPAKDSEPDEKSTQAGYAIREVHTQWVWPETLASMVQRFKRANDELQGVRELFTRNTGSLCINMYRQKDMALEDKEKVWHIIFVDETASVNYLKDRMNRIEIMEGGVGVVFIEKESRMAFEFCTPQWALSERKWAKRVDSRVGDICTETTYFYEK